MAPAYVVDFILRLIPQRFNTTSFIWHQQTFGTEPRPDINKADLWESQRCHEVCVLEFKVQAHSWRSLASLHSELLTSADTHSHRFQSGML